MKEKRYIKKVLRFACKNDNFIEAGIVKNPNKAGDNIYLMINGVTTKEMYYLRPDEALMVIACLSTALHEKLF